MASSESTPRDEQNNDATQQLPSNCMTDQQPNTTADFGPQKSLQHKDSSETASSIGRYATVCPDEQSMARLDTQENVTNNSEPVGLRRSGTDTTTHTFDSNGLREAGFRAEKEQNHKVEIDNEYFALNPWYNQQREKPVFGLASPLPRTVRRGMRWGRGDLRKSLYKVDEDAEDSVGIQDGQDSDKMRDTDEDLVDFHVPLDHGHASRPQQDTDHFTTDINGRNVKVRRVPSTEADEVLQDRNIDPEGREQAPVNEHGLTTSHQHEAPARNQFGLADGMPPLQELSSHSTTQTEKEMHEIRKREHEAKLAHYDKHRNPIARLRAKYPQAPAEFLATFIYLFIGLCVNLSVATSKQTTGSFETQAWGWGFAVMTGIYLGGGVSGAHLSPTISIALAVYRGFPWRMAILYICVQMFAGLCAGALAFALYRDAIYDIDPGLTLEITGKALFPKGPAFSTASGFFNDFVYMVVWVCIAFALGDDQNSPPGEGMSALVFGLASMSTMVALGYNTGLGISPARDLGPRLVALWAGYKEAFTESYWAYGPYGASVCGALFGGFVYDLFIFVGGESPVNYRWPKPGDIKRKVRNRKKRAQDKIQRAV